MAIPARSCGIDAEAPTVLDGNRDSRAAKELLNNEAGTICRTILWANPRAGLRGSRADEPILMSHYLQGAGGHANRTFDRKFIV